ncbi:hypothetical protein Clacol_007050 [Clathrus columnatus]|uniref:Uncharacterized protein n=1 Tax=Clathrus columnatus TaxID=1419009 RepID=A0AAV5ALL0_9AGAM|nr:hypothetical protein Clacol_007050 [Clathrus columnatus]
MTFTSHHLLMVCLVAWGHYRPGIACAAKLLEETNHLTITLPIPSNWIKEIDDEVAKYIHDIRDPIRNRLRIVPIGNVVKTEIITATFVAGLFSFCANLFTSTPYQQANGNVLSAIRQPDVCLLDISYWDLLCKIRTFNPKTPVLVLAFGNITSTIREVGPEKLGGVGDLSTKAKVLAKETGKSIREAHIEVGSLLLILLWDTHINHNIPALYAREESDYQLDRFTSHI